MSAVADSIFRETLPILVLDGGLGTTLEDIFHKDISTSLWSAKPIDDDPETIIAAHLAFLRAGADVILTATYQCAFTTFARGGFTREDAMRIMRKAVRLAAEAKRRYLSERDGAEDVTLDDRAQRRDIKIALSLGPFGATLSPAQEFDGFYPPPYGPKGFSPDEANYNAFPDSDEGRQREAEALEALTAFHLERLRIFAQDRETWELVDVVAFETVPLIREVRAIRKAVGILQKEMGVGDEKPWWISAVYPGGKFPQEQSPGGDRVEACEVVNAALGEEGTETVPVATPWALGVNCTDPRFLGAILEEMTSTVGNVVKRRHVRAPWLVVYPNRGDVYDVTSQTWSSAASQETGEGWAKIVLENVQRATERGVWHGLIVGGCCKTGPAEIAALTMQVRKPSNERS